MRKIYIVPVFLLGALFCFIAQYFLKTLCYPFPNVQNKYNSQALLTPEKFLDYQKKSGTKMTTLKAPKTLILCYDQSFFNHVLEKFGDKIKIEKIQLPINCRPGIAKWKDKEYCKETKQACRIYPQDNNTEGFFITKFKKIK